VTLGVAKRARAFTAGRLGEEHIMIERLEQQKRLTSNQWKLICTANVADLLGFL
jgi:hypothetical protein